METAPSFRPPSAQRVPRPRTGILVVAGFAAALASGGWAVAAPAEQPISASRFGLSIDGVEVASFSELGSIATSVALASPSSGMPAGTLVKSATVVLRRGTTRGTEMWAWHEMAARGGPAGAYRNAFVVAYDNSNKPVARFYLENAWPTRVELGLASAAKGPADTPMETVTLSCEFIQRTN